MREEYFRKKSRQYASVLYTGVLLCACFTSPVNADQDQLSGVKSEISRQEKQLSANQRQLTTLNSSLKKQEETIGRLARQIRQLSGTITSLQTQISSLKKEQRVLQQQKIGQTEMLKELLNTYYRQGQQSQLQILLSGEGSSEQDRMTVYAESLAKARQKAIDDLTETNRLLAEKKARIERQQTELEQQRTQLRQNAKQIEREQSAKKKTVSSIQQRIRSDNTYLSELKNNQQRLEKEIKVAAERVLVRMDGLSPYKGRLRWPVRGRVQHTFGSEQSSELRWKGMVIGAKAGTEVNATHDGTVVLSNWLRGYGLMVVIDHGHGDMSFYGYNQALLKQVGDKVKTGEPVALVGNSGGQKSDGLYFEIRRKGKPINPQSWLVR
ncbi:peptidoglycan DD-metalloendopeptidase family protein [Veronia pacifica]|uniref:Peptidase M23 n=1 Tax=Veronia pacifica TaxID=1080227 RepID=A0A1C3EGR6_9GAMM|nr:peptidoglycan DD-metalloendopeptidase family protein [Veronia pacifica]ODA32404.1 peptidase M23 [Veronia pacifica]